ncbi:EamA family transporter [Polycladomyces sp. WAk]|uniref:EamA family transporter n=1 Tax=Polycladomyces zharkentensis TaxID=2807616 RepID=A0ABS2WN16_9BACL|nr:DMT family transporter [Polycladomyces sp. WAk]MBN2910930.1 EamA family transporter [Polycladomyces sp. WAk]
MRSVTMAVPPSFHRLKGFAMVLAGATCWGLSGTAAQWLFQHQGFQPGWLVSLRLSLSGILLLFYFAFVQKQTVWQIWKQKSDRRQLLIFSILGMAGVQYTYFEAIQAGNAATATLLQYLGPIFVTIYVALRNRQLPGRKDIVAVVLALMGTGLLVTNGRLDRLTISLSAVFWGLGSAVTAAFYTLYPARLLSRWSSGVIVGWAMLIGGVGMNIIHPLWRTSGQVWTGSAWLLVGFVVIFGTLLAFYWYLDSLRYLTPTETSLLACAEPLAAAIVTVVWLHVPMGAWQTVGGICIVATVVALSKENKKPVD